MKISENWLRESVDLSGITRQQLLDKLTAAGLEVEGAEAIAPAFSGVVVAEILAVQTHPDAERLRVCQVSIGTADALQIVCGAPNARVGLKAPLATVGAKLPNDLSIKVGKLRGVESFGMLCSASELGLPVENDGLLELPSGAKVGQNIRDYLQLDDVVIELKMTPNRSDCLGLRGLVRELCALFDRRSLLIDPVAPAIAKHSDVLKIQLDDSPSCPRYLGQIVRGINIQAQTPPWMKEKLRRSGLRSIHPVVDITNFVLLELGQPMHAFDHKTIQGDVVVRRAQVGEQLKLLDEQVATLDPHFLVIADQQKALAVAGVMGGFDSRVHDQTTDILFESAYFSPSVIMGRARKLGLHTDASHRFERGVDPALPELALARATALLIEICGGVVGPVLRAEMTSELPKRVPVKLRKLRLHAVLGLNDQTSAEASISDQKVEQILRDLGFAVATITDGWQVTAHSARFDIEIEEDLIEEVARVFGYDHIPTTLPTLALAPLISAERVRPEADLRRLMATRDYQEAITFAFTSSELLKHFAMDAHPIKNPLSADIDVMRPSLLPNILQAMLQNQCRQVDRVRLFEIGVVFQNQGQQEPAHLAFAASGSALREQWGSATRQVDFYDLKGDIEALLQATGSSEQLRFVAADQSYLHPGRSATIVLAGRPVGVVGQLHPELVTQLDFKIAPIVAELRLDAIQNRAMPQVQTLSKFPSTRRDLAFVVDEVISFAEVRDAVWQSAGALLTQFDCFDVYRGNGVGAGKKSLAVSLILQDASRTLGDQEVDQLIERVVAVLAQKFAAQLRS